MIKAVIFDLDDTLISEKEYIESGYRHISKVLSKRFSKDAETLYQLLLELLNISSKNVFNRLLDRLGIVCVEEDIVELVEEYRKHFPDIHFYNDVLPCLEKLKKENIKTGIITDGYAESQRQKLQAVNASDYIEEIIVTDELGREYWKPHPFAFEKMREKFNVEFSEMIYIGDNPNKDFYISKILPIKSIRIVRSNSIYMNAPYYESVKENHRIKSLLNLNLLSITGE
ncbi:HAD family hydrolase [Ornithinibacillus halophilus]|uniref:Putative hydrolase of the HAD superfamily n=1 Tax=Ornithinibacillus halophilus TaxID=930117 RepID=A0A1M5GIH1_9BACI|nr:HAD-IA family hydrolase [Ornithinibacillus halophilus]SHG03321.1 putative hydrolase of the HAD superfamily [Ornithinibacillus halophilus]